MNETERDDLTATMVRLPRSVRLEVAALAKRERTSAAAIIRRLVIERLEQMAQDGKR